MARRDDAYDTDEPEDLAAETASETAAGACASADDEVGADGLDASPADSQTASPAARTRAAAPPAASRGQLRGPLWLALELLVVFVGVYAAFLLNNYREDRRDDSRRIAIYETLLAELDRTQLLVEDHRRVLDDVWMKPMVEPYDRGEQPFIFGVWLPTGQLSGTWEALLETGVDLLDPAFIQAVETHRSFVKFMLDQSARAVRMSDEHIVPAIDEQDFYDPATGRLRLRYRWYMELPRYLVGNAERARESTEFLRTEIRRRLEDEAGTVPDSEVPSP